MGEDKKLKYDDPEQSARFIETAERIQDENAEERFEEMVSKILKPKKPKSAILLQKD